MQMGVNFSPTDEHGFTFGPNCRAGGEAGSRGKQQNL